MAAGGRAVSAPVASGHELARFVPQGVIEHRRKLIADHTRLTNRLTAALKEYFPQALEWAGELASLAACEFLRRWPTLEALQQAPRRQRRNFYRAHHRLNPQELEQRLAHIDTARPLTSDRAVVQSWAVVVPLWIEQLRCLLSALQRLEATLLQLFQQHPDHEVFDSFPGAGAALRDCATSRFADIKSDVCATRGRPTYSSGSQLVVGPQRRTASPKPRIPIGESFLTSLAKIQAQNPVPRHFQRREGLVAPPQAASRSKSRPHSSGRTSPFRTHREPRDVCGTREEGKNLISSGYGRRSLSRPA